MSLSDIWLFVQQGVLSGIVTGSVYALLAVAIVMVFKTTDVPNFSQGEIFMAGGYLALFPLVVWGWPYWGAVLASLAVTALVGALFQRVVMQRVTASRGVGVQLVIATLGFAYLLKGLVRKTGLGDTPRSLPSLVPQDPIIIGQASLTLLDLAIFGTAVVVMVLLYLMFTRTRTGLAMRAVGQGQLQGRREEALQVLQHRAAGADRGAQIAVQQVEHVARHRPSRSGSRSPPNRIRRTPRSRPTVNGKALKST